MQTLETIAHCWNYSRLLRLHLSQFVISPPRRCNLVATVCYCPDDAETVAVLRGFETLRLDRIRWNFVPLAAHHLCRRAIGRNRVALDSSADWLLFCDVDYCFCGDSLDRLAAELPDELARGGPFLGFSRTLRSSISHELGDQEIERAGRDGIMPLFEPRYQLDSLPRPIGGSQWVTGEWAREHGYLKDHPKWQRSAATWKRTFEDKHLRTTSGLRVVGFECPDIYRIRHSKRGRFDIGIKL